MPLSIFRGAPPLADSPEALQHPRTDVDDDRRSSRWQPQPRCVNRHSVGSGKSPGQCCRGSMQAGTSTPFPIHTQTTWVSKAKHTTRRERGVYNRPRSGAETQSRCIFSVWASGIRRSSNACELARHSCAAASCATRRKVVPRRGRKGLDKGVS